MPERYYPQSLVETKIFLLFLLDNIKGPIDYTSLNRIIVENVDALTFEYSEALDELVESGHLCFDAIDGEKYYMIGDIGRETSRELYETLPVTVREDVLATISRYVRINNNGISLSCNIEEAQDKRYSINVRASDKRGEFINVTLLVSSYSEAERMKANFENNPSGIYRGFLFSLTGRLEYLS